jgi:hypothetical protein
MVILGGIKSSNIKDEINMDSCGKKQLYIIDSENGEIILQI